MNNKTIIGLAVLAVSGVLVACDGPDDDNAVSESRPQYHEFA